MYEVFGVIIIYPQCKEIVGVALLGWSCGLARILTLPVRLQILLLLVDYFHPKPHKIMHMLEMQATVKVTPAGT